MEVLSPHLRTRIRSGATIASVTQCAEELVQNAIDADATCVAVRVHLTLRKLQVVDNGCGISKKDMVKVGSRYMTSKCRRIEDLELANRGFYGYRGEALSSIRQLSSILQIVSRKREEDGTWSTLFARGKRKPVEAFHLERRSLGTTVTVVDFLYNLPVRKKLIHPVLDLTDIHRAVVALALVNPGVSFTLRNEVSGEVMLQTNQSADPTKVFQSVYGPQWNLLDICYSNGDYSLKGFVASEGFTNREKQFVYVRRRCLRRAKICKLVNSCFKRSLLASETNDATKKTYPVFFLSFCCPFREVDFTCEARKTEVSFAKWDKVAKFFSDGITEFLKQNKLLPPTVETSSSPLRGQFDGLPDITGIRPLEDAETPMCELKKKHLDVAELAGVRQSAPVARRANKRARDFVTSTPCPPRKRRPTNQSWRVASVRKRFEKETAMGNANANAKVAVRRVLEADTLPLITSPAHGRFMDEGEINNNIVGQEWQQGKGSFVNASGYKPTRNKAHPDASNESIECPRRIRTEVNGTKFLRNLEERERQDVAVEETSFLENEKKQKQVKWTNFDQPANKSFDLMENFKETNFGKRYRRWEQKDVDFSESGERCAEEKYFIPASYCSRTDWRSVPEASNRMSSEQQFDVDCLDYAANFQQEVSGGGEMGFFSNVRREKRKTSSRVWDMERTDDEWLRKLENPLDDLAAKDGGRKQSQSDPDEWEQEEAVFGEISILVDEEEERQPESGFAVAPDSALNGFPLAKTVPGELSQRFETRRSDGRKRCHTNQSIAGSQLFLNSNQGQTVYPTRVRNGGVGEVGIIQHELTFSPGDESWKQFPMTGILPDQSFVDANWKSQNSLERFDSNSVGLWRGEQTKSAKETAGLDFFLMQRRAESTFENGGLEELVTNRTFFTLNPPPVGIPHGGSFYDAFQPLLEIESPEKRPDLSSTSYVDDEQPTSFDRFDKIDPHCGEHSSVLKQQNGSSEPEKRHGSASDSDEFSLNDRNETQFAFGTSTVVSKFDVRRSLRERFHPGEVTNFTFNETIKVYKSYQVETDERWDGEEDFEGEQQLAKWAKRRRRCQVTLDTTMHFPWKRKGFRDVRKADSNSTTDAETGPGPGNLACVQADKSGDLPLPPNPFDFQTFPTSANVSSGVQDCGRLKNEPFACQTKFTFEGRGKFPTSGFELFEETVIKDDLPEGWVVRSKGDRKFYVHLRSGTISDDFLQCPTKPKRHKETPWPLPAGTSPFAAMKASGTRFGVNLKATEWENAVFPYQSEPPNLRDAGNAVRFNRGMFKTIRVLGQADNKFIVAKENGLLLLFDQHAVHERIRLEQSMEENYPGQKGVLSQQVEKPLRISFDDGQVKIMTQYEEKFQEFGVGFSLDEEGFVVISKLPKCFFLSQSFCPMMKLARSVVEDIVDGVRETRGGGLGILPRTIHDVLSSRACKGAIKFGDALSFQECARLVTQLQHCKLPFQCAHGRPSLSPVLDLNELSTCSPDHYRPGRLCFERLCCQEP